MAHALTRCGALVALLVMLLAVALSASTGRATTGGSGSADIQEVNQPPAGLGLIRHPLLVKVRGRDRRGAPLVSSGSPAGYMPSQIQAYLGVAGDGAGQTIAIVGAFDDPNIEGDLDTFSATFGLPLVCGTLGADPSNCVNFTKATPHGSPSADAGWALETSLDVEWAHAVAPQADILLVESPTNQDVDMFGAVDYAATHNASVISNSWGEAEFNGEVALDAHCHLATSVCVASTGDGGNPGLYPAFSPDVVAVGGTSLSLAADGSVVGETAWNGSGGGVSLYEARPSYQNPVSSQSHRGIPDVSYAADPAMGFAVYDSFGYQGQSAWFELGGTSAGAPQWAAIIAVADQLRAAAGRSRLTAADWQTNVHLYGPPRLTALHDVTSGTNGNCGAICTASANYDFVAGLGSPRATIASALAASPGNCRVDLNHDGAVTFPDLLVFAQAYSSTPNKPNWNPAADFDGDGDVAFPDLLLFAAFFGVSACAP